MSAIRQAVESYPSEHSSADGPNRFLPSAESSNNRIEHSRAPGVAPDRGQPTASTRPDCRPSLPPRCRQKSPSEQEAAPAVAQQRPSLVHFPHPVEKSELPRYFWTRLEDLLTDSIGWRLQKLETKTLAKPSC